MARRPKAPHVGDLLAEVFRRGGMKRAVKRAEAVLLWPQVVGPEVARFTEARTLQDGVLYVDATDSETVMHLSFQKERFLAVYRGKFGVREVRDVRFRVGRRASERTEAPPPPPPPDPRELADVARRLGELDLPDELAGPAMRAAKAMVAARARRRAEGWRPCPTCDALTDTGGACAACARYARDPKVERASRMLAVRPDAPTPLLSDEERAVAARMAEEGLEETVLELLPQVLAEPGKRLELETVARCLLALRLGKPLAEVGEDDLMHLDARVARALGRWG